MRTRIPTLSILLTLAVTAAARADTFTWAGADGNFSNPASWIGTPPTSGGSATDQLLFPDPPPAGYTATLDTPGPWILNTLTVGTPVPSNGTPVIVVYPIPTVILNAAPGASLLFTGPNPSINVSPYDALTINAPITTTSDLALTGGQLTLNGPLTFTTSSQLNLSSANLIYQNNIAPTGLTQTNINNGSLEWNYTLADAAPTTLAFGSGDIILNNGTFGVDAAQNTSTDFNINIANNFSIQGLAELQTGFNYSGSTYPLPAGAFHYTGTIHLNGTLQILSSVATDIAGTIELNEAGNVQPSLQAFNTSDPSASIITISGAITDDPDPAHQGTQPLALQGFYGLNITGTDNTYSVGTAIEYGDIFVAPTSSLGTGSVDIQGGTLHLSAPTNIAAGRTILIEQSGILAITFDADPSALLDPASSGTLALDPPNGSFSTPLNLATLGNGMMSLGTTSNSTYAATTLAPGIDHVYRFAQVPNTADSLTLLHSVLIDENGIPSSAQLAGVILPVPNSYSGGSAILGDVYANAPGALGTGNVTIGDLNAYVYNNPGHLYLSVPNAYAPNATVNIYATLAAVGSNGSIPLTATPPIFHPGSTLILGDNLTNNSDRYPDTMPLNLHTSTLQLDGFGATNETVGPISFAGLSTIVFQNQFPYGVQTSPTAPTVTSLTTSSLAAANHAVLFIELTEASFDPTSTSSAALYITSPPQLTNGILPPYIQSRPSSDDDESSSVSFLTYTATGIAPAAYVPLPTNGGAGTEVVDIPENADANNNAIPVTLPMSTSIYALRTATSIANPSTGAATLHILSGGLIVNAGGTDYLLISPNIDFSNTEAYINAASNYDFGGNIIELAGQVTATDGITKFGEGIILFSNPTNTISGPLTIYEGGLSFAALPSPNSTQPINMSTGTSLNFINTTTLSRPLYFTADGLNFGLNANITSNQSLTLAAPITGNGGVNITADTALNITYPLNFNGDFLLTAPTVHLAANITVSQGVSITGVLTGAGTISQNTGGYLYSGGISPGDQPGDLATLTLNMPTCEIEYGETFAFDLASSGLSDRILFTGSLTLDPVDPNDAYETPNTLALNFLAPPTGQIYTLLSAASLAGTFTTVTGLPDDYTLDYTPTAILLIPNGASPVPEPASLCLLMGAMGALFRRRVR